ncbi:ornithine cyclodeaminase/mu-crystallin family protein [Paraburkholderia fungorum]|uniref:Ornithine cyclodeaminase/mu-crystallin family protein n=1 Tax=Paraburkholderia fungorum TaxID=134537 RepID=A0AAU8TEX2_9BURK|nr:ornithine cyclodeaminase family protein [Paraburkholderia fungorum]AJZ58975.1 ornithine cyclodeaminase/mu-crystallin family protein [Paraburkholderia fungorum]
MVEPIWISEKSVVELMNLPEAIETLEQGLALEANGEARNMMKTHVAWGNNNLHAIGAAYPGAGIIGTKTWAHTLGGACPLLILFDAETGQLKAIIEAFALGQMRTGGISGVATKWLADEKADVLALIGTGKQALAQLAAVHAVRPLKQVRVFSPRAESRRAFIDKASEQFDVDFLGATSVGQALAGAPIITTVTRATQAFLHSVNVAPGAHINAVGAITGEREELAQDVFARCSRVVVDDQGAAQCLSSELIRAFGANDGWSKVPSLSAVVAGKRSRRPEDDITVFKAMGMGVSDLALGIELYRRAVARGIGNTIPQPQRHAPRLMC